MYRIIERDELLKMVDPVRCSAIFMVVGKDKAFYLTFDKPGKKAEERVWYRLSLNPFEENSYKLVELKEAIIDNNQCTYTDFVKFAQFKVEDPLMDRNMAMLDMLYFKQNGVQMKVKDVADMLNITTSRVHQLKNMMSELFRKVLKEILVPFDKEYTLGNLQDFYGSWLSMLIEINKEFEINNKVRRRFVDFLIRNKLVKLSLYKKYIQDHPVKSITDSIRVFKGTSTSGETSYDKIMRCIDVLYNLNQSNLDPLKFYQ